MKRLLYRAGKVSGIAEKKDRASSPFISDAIAAAPCEPGSSGDPPLLLSRCAGFLSPAELTAASIVNVSGCILPFAWLYSSGQTLVPQGCSGEKTAKTDFEFLTHSGKKGDSIRMTESLFFGKVKYFRYSLQPSAPGRILEQDIVFLANRCDNFMQRRRIRCFRVQGDTERAGTPFTEVKPNTIFPVDHNLLGILCA